jgi:hypothetical protein
MTAYRYSLQTEIPVEIGSRSFGWLQTINDDACPGKRAFGIGITNIAPYGLRKFMLRKRIGKNEHQDKYQSIFFFECFHGYFKLILQENDEAGKRLMACSPLRLN